MSQNIKFIESTVGLTCCHETREIRPKLLRVEFYQLPCGNIKLQVVSGHNLAPLRGDHTTITAEEYENAPRNPYDDCELAVWALRKCGWIAD